MSTLLGFLVAGTLVAVALTNWVTVSRLNMLVRAVNNLGARTTPPIQHDPDEHHWGGT